MSAAPQRPTETLEALLTPWEAFRHAKKEVWRAYKELWQAHLDHLNGAPARPFSLVTAYREAWQVAVDLWPFEGRADNPADVTAAREKPTAGLATEWACVYHPDIADDTAQKSAAWTAAEPERKRIEEERRAARIAEAEAEREREAKREAEAKQQSRSTYQP